MATQKKTVRLSETSLLTLGRSGADLDTKISQRLNCALDRYGAVLYEVAEDKEKPDRIFREWFGALMVSTMRIECSLPPLPVVAGPAQERAEVIRNESFEALNLWYDKQSNESEVMPGLDMGQYLHDLEYFASESSALDLVKLLEDVEPLAQELGSWKNVVEAESGYFGIPAGNSTIWVDTGGGTTGPYEEVGEGEYYELHLHFWSENDDPNDRFELELQGEDLSSEVKANSVCEVVPLGCKACLINDEAMMRLGLRIAPFLNQAREEAAEGVFGEHRKKIQTLIHDAVPGLASPVPSIHGLDFMTAHPKSFAELVERCTDAAAGIGEGQYKQVFWQVLYELEREWSLHFVSPETLLHEVLNAVEREPTSRLH